MGVFKRTVMFTVVMLACAGVYSALRNMPISTGCSFYGQCPDNAAKAELPSVASMETSAEALAP
jgi:hypothetical protein